MIDLGVLGATDGPGDDRPARRRRPPASRRQRLLAGVVALTCLLALVAAAPGRPVLGEPLWSGPVSLNGFTLGTRNLYVARSDGLAVTALDVRTGRPRWSRDTTDLPDSTRDVGNGVAVVMTRPAGAGEGQSPATITLIRDATGEPIAQTTGGYYRPSVDGRLLLVFSVRSGEAGSCAGAQTCFDIAARDTGTGRERWRLSLPPGHGVFPYLIDGGVEALLEFAADGTIRLRDIATGAVAGTTALSPELFGAGSQVGLVGDQLLTAQRGPDAITLTAYRLPRLGRSWSVAIPDRTPTDDQGGGVLHLQDCGPDACLALVGAGTRLIDLATGAVAPPIPFEIIQRLGAGVFLASPDPAPPNGRSRGVTGFVVAADGRTVATVTVVALVDWVGSGDRALLTQEGPARTGFLVVDDHGGVHSLGSVPGVGLTCHARAAILACSDPAGTLRVWDLPA